jgi:hypothetical protein
MPVAIPLEEPMVACAFVLVHTPPKEASVRSAADPAHMDAGALMGLIEGSRFIVMILVVDARPHAPTNV